MLRETLHGKGSTYGGQFEQYRAVSVIEQYCGVILLDHQVGPFTGRRQILVALHAALSCLGPQIFCANKPHMD